jgi:hypothetical protein
MKPQNLTRPELGAAPEFEQMNLREWAADLDKPGRSRNIGASGGKSMAALRIKLSNGT